MLKRLVYLGLAAVLCACGAIGGEASPLDGVVTLSSPPAGAVIYSSAIYVAGTVTGVPEKDLLVQLVGADGDVIASLPVMAASGEWSFEWVHEAAPQAATVRVLPADAPDAGVLVSSEIILAALSERPDGVFITLSTPEDGTELGGDMIYVSGTASGLQDAIVTVTLTDSAQTVIDEKTVSLGARYPLDEIPWAVELATQGKLGNAVLQVRLPDATEQAVTVILVPQAG